MSFNVFSELWNKRSLIALLAINDVKLRYRNSVLGFLWTILEPLLMLSILYFIFTNIIISEIENYALYLLLGLIIWYMFSRATTMGTSSLVDRAGMLQKIYFRREIVVISSCLTAFIMVIFEFIVFGVFLAAFQFVPPTTALILPLILVNVFFLSLGVSLFLSSLNVFFRDIKFIWQILLQAGFFLSPIIYTLEMFPDNIRWLLELNPLVLILDTAHNAVLYGLLPPVIAVIQMIITTLTILAIGYVVFRVKDKRIVEAL